MVYILTPQFLICGEMITNYLRVAYHEQNFTLLCFGKHFVTEPKRHSNFSVSAKNKPCDVMFAQ